MMVQLIHRAILVGELLFDVWVPQLTSDFARLKPTQFISLLLGEPEKKFAVKQYITLKYINV